MLNITNTKDPAFKPSTVMVVYGEGGVGKTTFASTAPKPLLIDCENGSKFLGLRGIDMDVAQIKKWADMKDVLDAAVNGGYETLIIDPIGELMEKLQHHLVALRDSKLVQKDGSPTMAGWGWLKKTMRSYIKLLRGSGLHVIFIAHVDDEKDEDRIIKAPMLATKLKKELINMVDVVGYMTVIQQDEETKRVIIVDPESDKYVAKDRTGQLGRFIEPDFTKIVNAIAETETYSWSSPEAKKKKEPIKKAEDDELIQESVSTEEKEPKKKELTQDEAVELLTKPEPTKEDQESAEIEKAISKKKMDAKLKVASKK